MNQYEQNYSTSKGNFKSNTKIKMKSDFSMFTKLCMNSNICYESIDYAFARRETYMFKLEK